HPERVPAVEECWIDIDALPVLFHRAFKLPDPEIAIRVVENFVTRLHFNKILEGRALSRPKLKRNLGRHRGRPSIKIFSAAVAEHPDVAGPRRNAPADAMVVRSPRTNRPRVARRAAIR